MKFQFFKEIHGRWYRNIFTVKAGLGISDNFHLTIEVWLISLRSEAQFKIVYPLEDDYIINIVDTDFLTSI